MNVQRMGVWLVLVAGLLGPGCLHKEYKLILKEDGSGQLTARITVDGAVAEDLERMNASARGHMARFRPGVSLKEKDIRALGETEGIEVRAASVERAEDGDRVIQYDIAFDSIKTFAETAGAEFFQFELRKRSDGTIVFQPRDVWSMVLDDMGRQDEEQQVKAGLAMLRMQLRDATYRLEAHLPGVVTQAPLGETDGNRVVWDLSAKDLTLERILDEDGMPNPPQATFAGDNVAFELPVVAQHASSGPFGAAGNSWEEVPVVERTQQQQGFSVIPTRFSSSTNVRPGQSTPRRATASLTLQVGCPADVNVLAYANMTISEALAGDGTDLRNPRERRHQQERRVMTHYGRGREDGLPQTFAIDIPLGEGATAAERIAVLKGTVELKVAENTHSVTVKPVPDAAGTAITVPGAEDLDIHLQNVDGNSVTLRFGQKAHHRKASVIFLDRDGSEMPHRGHQGSGGGKYYTETYDIALPGDGAIRLQFVGEPHREILPFEVTNLVLDPANVAAPMAEEGFADVALERLSVNRNLYFQQQNMDQSSASLRLAVTTTQPIHPISATRVAIEEAVTQKGDKLDLELNHSNVHAYPTTTPGGSAPKMSLQVNLRKPPPGVLSLARLKGTFELHYAATVRRAIIGPVNDWIGKSVTVPGVEGFDVVIVSHDETSVTLRMPGNRQHILKDVSFETADGRRLDVRGSSGRGAQHYLMREYQVKLPEDGTVVLDLYDDLQRRTVPFTLTGLGNSE